MLSKQIAKKIEDIIVYEKDNLYKGLPKRTLTLIDYLLAYSITEEDAKFDEEVNNYCKKDLNILMIWTPTLNSRDVFRTIYPILGQEKYNVAVLNSAKRMLNPNYIHMPLILSTVVDYKHIFFIETEDIFNSEFSIYNILDIFDSKHDMKNILNKGFLFKEILSEDDFRSSSSPDEFNDPAFPRPSAVVWTEKTGIGVFMYVQERSTRDNAVCSIFSREHNKIMNVDISAVKPYKNHCWNCGQSTDSSIDSTCTSCHWVMCPICDCCKMGSCSQDNITILDVLDIYRCENHEFTEHYFDEYAYKDKFYYLGEGSTDEVERCFNHLMSNQIELYIAINDIGVVSIYTTKRFKDISISLLNNIDARLYDSVQDEYGFNSMYENKSMNKSMMEDSGCMFCGSSRAPGDTLCEVCAGNID